ncbi:glycine betaine transporter [Salinihabitans flavidus]|uniref:Glycine betaine transporter n=1 Tax=Salinihabitans flavidus TaxID=569882 RepID=A0A1H8SJC8_9RHOB|nr:BCCT family transporter [Salinihabitans flavidus]SEO78484.1 glycine betaine transporter [Salinihabitans flavidus]
MSNRPTDRKASLLGDVGAVFRVSVAIVAVFVITAAIAPARVEELAQIVLHATAENVGWMYLLVTTGFVGFIFFLGFSRTGDIRLGPPDEPPEFSYASWLAMIFSGGMGVGLVFWGVAEPIMHFNEPPLDSGLPRTAQAAQTGMRYAFFHWGLHQWANFALVGLAIAYVRFRHQSFGLISETFRPLLGDRVDTGWGKAIDILTVVSTVFGVATTLGLGALQINSGLARLTDVPYGFPAQFVIIAVIGGLFMLSAMTPLDKGVRLLSNANMLLAGFLLLVVLVFGPTSFIFGVMTQTLGEYLGNLLQMSLVTTPYSSGQWVEQWTMFYWAWGLSWAPFVGSFIARISRGRTIREFVTGVMVVPVALSMLWFATFGGAAIHFEIFGNAGIADAVAEEVPAGLYVMLDQLPFGTLLTVVAIVLVCMFLITSADSATFVLGMFTSKGVLNPTRAVRLLWGCLQLLMVVVLLLTGGLESLRTVSIIAAFPFMLLMVLIAVSLYRDLSQEIAMQTEKSRLLDLRVERLLLRDSEREAARQAEEEVHPTTPEDPQGDKETEAEGEDGETTPPAA